jgi:hypothetical protein
MNSEELKKKAKLIKQLLANAESEKALGNLAAAEAFAGKVSELCDKYRLSIAELPEDELRETVSREYWDLTDIGQKHKWQRSHWLTTLGYAIAFGHRCALLTTVGMARLGFIGLEQDVEVCRAMMSILTRSAQACFGQFKKEHKGAKVRPYMSGFAMAILKRYAVQREEMEKNTSSMALMCIVDKLVERAVEGIKKERQSPKMPAVDDSFKRGIEDGNRQDLRARLLHDGDATSPLLLNGNLP